MNYKEAYSIAMSLGTSVISIFFILALSLIFRLVAIIVISKDSKKRNIKCWYWNLLTLFFGAIPVIFYIIIVCLDKPDDNKIIDMRPFNSNENPKEIHTIDYKNQARIKTPKYLIFYVVSQIIFFILNNFIALNIVKQIYIIGEFGNEQIESYSYFHDRIDGFENNNGKYFNKFKNDIEDYAYEIYNSLSDEITKSAIKTNNNFATFKPSVSNKSIKLDDKPFDFANLTQYFKDTLVTYEFEYTEKNQGFLSLEPNLNNLTLQEIEKIKNKSRKHFFSDEVNYVIIISQSIEGNHNLINYKDFDIDDFETINLNKYGIQYGYPLYISLYSNISSDKYELNLTLI